MGKTLLAGSRWTVRLLASALASALVAAPVFGGLSCADVQVIDEGLAPVILAVEPAVGPAEGGTAVAIVGADFEEGATVRFGGELATQVIRIDAETLNAVSPPGVGVVSVSVQNPNRKSDTLDDAFTYDGSLGGCAVASSAPGLGATDVPVTGELRLTFDRPIDAASLEDAVTLRRLGGEEVPADVVLDAETGDVLVRPAHSLRFWASYAVVTTTGVKSTDGAPCAPAAIAFSTIAPEALPRALRAAPVSGLALVGQTVIAASETYRGLQIYDVADPSGATLASDVATAFSPRNVVVRGARAYVPSGFLGVQIFDVSSPAAPQWLGYGGTPGRANDVAVIEKAGKTFLVVADADGGARVLDATDPTAVLEIGALDLGGGKRNVTAVDASGDRIVLAEDTKFRLIDLPDPASLATQVTLATVDITYLVSDVILAENRLYLGRGVFGVASYDLADPLAPALIGVADDPDGACPDACKYSAARMVKDGDELFVTFARGGVMGYSIDAKGALTAGKVYPVVGDVRSVAVSPTRVYAGGDEGLVVFDRQKGGEPLWFDEFGHGRARTVHVRDGFAYVGALLRGVQTFSIASPEAPELVDRDDTPASLTADDAAVGVASGDGVLQIGDGRAGVTLFDLTNPADPVLAGSVDTTDGVRAITSVANVVYACNDNQGVVVVDATEVAAPTLLGQVPFNDVAVVDACRDVMVDGPLAYVGRLNGLGVLDVSSPSAPAWKGLVVFPGKEGVTGVRKAGASHLFVTTSKFDYEGPENGSARAHVLDVSDPVSPKVVWSSAPLDRAAGVAVVGDKAFVAAGNFGVAVFDLSNVAEPVLEGTIPTPGTVSFTAVGPDVLYVAQGAGGLQAIRTGPLPSQ